MTVFDLELCSIRDDQSNEFLVNTNETTLRKMNKKQQQDKNEEVMAQK